MQQNNYIEAEDAYRRALIIAPDNNKMCNLGICLMKQGRIAEAKETLRRVKPAMADGPRGVDSHLKAYERAQQMLKDLESEMMNQGGDRVQQSKLFDAFLGSSSIWQPQPCKDHHANASKSQDDFGDENIDANIITNQSTGLGQQRYMKSLTFNGNLNSLNKDAPPFYSTKVVNEKEPFGVQFNNNETLKRTRSGNAASGMRFGEAAAESTKPLVEGPEKTENKSRRLSASPEEKSENLMELLPDNDDFEEAILAAVLGQSKEPGKTVETDSSNNNSNSTWNVPKKIDKRLKVFQDITLSLSPKA